MAGSLLICGGTKQQRQHKAWEYLLPHGFKADTMYPDLFMLEKEEDKKSIGILRAKEITKFVMERPYEKQIKAVLVLDAQSLTNEAQNSLLKVLEEPPAYVQVILLCDKEGSLLPTIISRCQRAYLKDVNLQGTPEGIYDLSKLEIDELFDLAKEISVKDKSEVIEFLENVLRFDLYADSSRLAAARSNNIEHSCLNNSKGEGTDPDKRSDDGSLPSSRGEAVAIQLGLSTRDGIASAPAVPRNDEERGEVVIEMEKAIKGIREANVAVKFALEYLFLLHKKGSFS